MNHHDICDEEYDEMRQEQVFRWFDVLVSILAVCGCAAFAWMAWQVWPLVVAVMN